MVADVEGTIYHFGEAAELNPSNAEDKHNLAVALAEAGRDEIALNFLIEAMKLPMDAALKSNVENTLQRQLTKMGLPVPLDLNTLGSQTSLDQTGISSENESLPKPAPTETPSFRSQDNSSHSWFSACQC